MAEEIRRVIDGRPLLAGPRRPLHSAWLHARRRPLTTVIGAVLMLVALGLGVRLATTNRALTAAIQESRAAAHQRELAIEGQAELIADATRIVAEQLDVVIGATETRRRMIDDLMVQARRLENAGIGGRSIRVSIAQLLGAQGDLAFGAGDMDEARRIRTEVVDRADALAVEAPFGPERGRWYANALIKLGDIMKTQGDAQQALLLYERAERIQDSLLEAYPEHALGLLDDLCWSIHRLSYLRFPGRFDEPGFIESVHQRHALALELLELDRTRTLSVFNLADVELMLHDVALAEGNPAAARAYAASALERARALVTAEPDRLHFNTFLVHCLCERSLVVLDEDEPEALALADEALARAKRLAMVDPLRAEARTIWCEALVNGIRIARRIGDANDHAHRLNDLRDAIVTLPEGRQADRLTRFVTRESRTPVP